MTSLDSKPSILFPQRSAVFSITIVILFVVALAIGWFTITQILGPFQAIGRTISFQVGGASPLFVSVDQFFTYLIMLGLAVSVIGLLLWVFMYNQNRGTEVG